MERDIDPVWRVQRTSDDRERQDPREQQPRREPRPEAAPDPGPPPDDGDGSLIDIRV